VCSRQIPVYLKQLKYADEPDYKFLEQIITKAVKRLGIRNDEPFDWEENYQSVSPSTGLHGAAGGGLTPAKQQVITQKSKQQVSLRKTKEVRKNMKILILKKSIKK
jgi:hypothetical protein